MLGRWMSEKKKVYVCVCGEPGGERGRGRERVVVFENEILFLFFVFFFSVYIYIKICAPPLFFFFFFFLCCFACISLWRLGGLGFRRGV